jgi:RNA polymerase sigma factor (sigma-70 family)
MPDRLRSARRQREMFDFTSTHAMKNAGAISWSGVGSAEAACADLVAAHQRMVYGLAFNLLGDRDEARDVSQEVFLRVFRTLSGFRGQSALRTWIYRIVVNQVHNRQRWWRRRHRSDVISLDQHLREFGDLESKRDILPDRLLVSKETAAYYLGRARAAAVR